MPVDLKRRAERWTLTAMIVATIAITVGDTVGLFDDKGGVVAKATLVLLGLITAFLLFEVQRFHKFDQIEASLAKLDIDGLAATLREKHYAGLTEVHDDFSDQLFGRYVDGAKQVTILNTWIPNLDDLRGDLERAVKQGAEVRILLLHPESNAVDLRGRALRERGVERVGEPVRKGIVDCLNVLGAMHAGLDRPDRAKLRVRLYNSLPSVSVYRADERYLVGMFLHRQLAIRSPQFRIEGTATVLGRQIQQELDTLWEIGRDIDPGNWQHDLYP
ncbi:DUF5919 domain-containing protein [Saccharothrix stipae]